MKLFRKRKYPDLTWHAERDKIRDEIKQAMADRQFPKVDDLQDHLAWLDKKIQRGKI